MKTLIFTVPSLQLMTAPHFPVVEPYLFAPIIR